MSFRAYEDERLCMDFDSGNVLLDSTPLTMTRKERELLAFLIENRSEIVPRAVLLDRIWGYSTEIRTRTLDVHIRRLRKKLGSYGEGCIETVFGVGYRFQGHRRSATPWSVRLQWEIPHAPANFPAQAA